jgi:uncharacterized membrane protein YfcA
MRKCTLRRTVIVLAMIAVTGLGFLCLIHAYRSSFQLGIRREVASNEKAGLTKATEACADRDVTRKKPGFAPAFLTGAHVNRDRDFQNRSGPTTDLSSFSVPVLAWIAFVMLVGGFAHGMIGFGFPIIATPLLTLVLPMKQAILVLLVPTLVMTVLNALRGGRFRESIGRYWYLPFLLVIGAFAGTRLLIVTPNEPFVLLLAAVLFVYLNMERLGKTDVRVVSEHPQVSAVVFGLVAGVFEGTANVSGPPLLVYFLLIGLSPRAIVQTLNFAFVAGKLSQTVTWTVSGGISFAEWAQTLPWVMLAAVTLVFGRRIHDRISTFTYMRWLRGFLWAMVALLLAQFIRLMAVRFI